MRLPLVLFVSVAFLSCAHSSSTPKDEPADEPSREEAPQAGGATIPETPAGEKLEWFLVRINENGGMLSADEVEQNFSPSFLEQVPADDLISTFKQVSQGLAPLRLESVTEQSAHSLIARASSKQGPVRLNVAVESEPPHRFQGLLISPDAQ